MDHTYEELISIANKHCIDDQNNTSSKNKKARNRHHRKYTSQFDDGNRIRKKSCKLCSKQTETDEELAKHVETEHANKIQEFNSQKISREFSIPCSYCDQHFEFQNLYYEHARKNHLDKISKEWHPCQTCSMYFSSQTDLILHNNVSHCDREVRKCQFCDEKFPSDFEYHKHVNDKHKDMATCENWKPCERCLCLFPSSKELSRHRVQHHFHEIVKTRAYPAKPKPQTRHALWKIATTSKLKEDSTPQTEVLMSDQIETDLEEFVYIVTDTGMQVQHTHTDVEGCGKEITSLQVDDNVITFQIKGE